MRYVRLVLFGCLSVGVLIFVGRLRLFSFSSNDSASHVISAIDYHNEAAAIENKAGDTGGVGVISSTDWKTIYRYDEKALDEAQKADISDMNRYYPGFGDHFKNEFIEGMRIIIKNANNPQHISELIRGQVLLDRFGDWYEANESAMRSRK